MNFTKDKTKQRNKNKTKKKFSGKFGSIETIILRKILVERNFVCHK